MIEIKNQDRAVLHTVNADTLVGADLSHANLWRADLSKADLSHADLYDANLSSADLYLADLRHANLNNANLSYANLRYAKGILSVGPIGVSCRIIYAVAHKTVAMVQAGCFWGTVDEFESRIKDKYKDSPAKDSYLATIPLIRAWYASQEVTK